MADGVREYKGSLIEFRHDEWLCRFRVKRNGVVDIVSGSGMQKEV